MCQMRGPSRRASTAPGWAAACGGVTSPSEDLLMNKDLCKVQVNAPPSLEIPAKFFERYCALPNNSAMSASVQADGATAAIASTASMRFTTKGGALASRDQPQEAGAEESGAARDRGRHRCERIDETRPRDPHTASRVSLGASRLLVSFCTGSFN